MSVKQHRLNPCSGTPMDLLETCFEFPSNLIGKLTMAFWTGQLWSGTTSYPDIQVGAQNNNFGPVSQIECWKFGSVCACAGDGYRQPCENWTKVKWENKERGGDEKNVLSLPSVTSFSHPLPNHFLIRLLTLQKREQKNTLISTRLWISSVYTWFKFGVAGGHPTNNHFYVSLYYINNTFQALTTVRVLILVVFMVHPDKQKWY